MTGPARPATPEEQLRFLVVCRGCLPHTPNALMLARYLEHDAARIHAALHTLTYGHEPRVVVREVGK